MRMLVAVTVAPGTTAPVGSVTVPVTVPVMVCALMAAVESRMHAAGSSHGTLGDRLFTGTLRNSEP